jgi:hypothetical protein
MYELDHQDRTAAEDGHAGAVAELRNGIVER